MFFVLLHHKLFFDHYAGMKRNREARLLLNRYLLQKKFLQTTYF